ncbi:hypothetical protein LZ554_000877 [Drepanopeziza brunnea f. sp. 'monogermtubi']|nr:hypothetical protein LZ554_000877 [Drepanopeziza brunnea f. sp. 'monogermtubi']
MHISRIAPILVAAAVLAPTSWASPIDIAGKVPSRNDTVSILEPSSDGNATKTSVTDEDYTAIADSFPTNLPGAVIRDVSLPPSEDVVDPWAAIHDALATYDLSYGHPSPGAIEALSPEQRGIIANLDSMIPLLEGQEEKETAQMVARLVAQKLLHPEAPDDGFAEQAAGVVDSAKKDIGMGEASSSTTTTAPVGESPDADADADASDEDDTGDGDDAAIENHAADAGVDGDHACSSSAGLTVHARAACNSMSKSKKKPKKPKKSKKPKYCADGTVEPDSGAQDCPPAAQWQAAQHQGRALQTHLRKKERADKRRDDKRIARTVFMSLSCAVITPLLWLCPLMTIPGAI